ncbi:hypothetical protein ONZ51_g9395 [Trametes cubensis]|uniref:Uncharacterized protein n=1 Tax=Trametes cubensis TaxID=1111947 RepID=A0AAD7TLE6_9APHY|nr:hypothetical protein ONZ51_g9395 [Trametes cubensis]
MASNRGISILKQCLLCPIAPFATGTGTPQSLEDALAQPRIMIVDGSTPMGLAQLAWLQRAQLDFNLSATLDSVQNTLNVCMYHQSLLKAGAIVLCPPLRDLRHLIEYEKKDWQARFDKCKTADHVPGNVTVPSRTAPQNLSGYLSCIWQGSYHNYFDTDTGTITYATSSRSSDSFPPKLVLPPQLLCRNLGDRTSYLEVELPSTSDNQTPVFELALRFNFPGQTWRVNPYAIMVRAMEMLHAPYPPDDIFFCDYPTSDRVIHMENPIGKYEALLLELRTLYSRTNEDLLRQCGLSEEVEGTIASHCHQDLWVPYDAYWESWTNKHWQDGSEEDQESLLDVMASHGVERISFDGGRYDDPRQWLSALNAIPLDNDPLIDDFTNLMFVCEEHANAYNCGAWRWMPSSIDTNIDTAPDTSPKHAQSVYAHTDFEVRNEGASSSITANPGLNIDNTTFDLLIFLPQAMPPIGLLRDLKSNSIAMRAEAFQDATSPRVLRSFRTLHLNPYITYTSMLRMVGAAYLPPPDNDLKAVEDECLRIHAIWNDRLRNHGTPVLCEALEDTRLCDLKFLLHGDL